MYQTRNKGKPVVADRFAGTLKNTIYKYMTSVSKSLHIDKLENIVNTSINMKPADLKLGTYFDFG